MEKRKLSLGDDFGSEAESEVNVVPPWKRPHLNEQTFSMPNNSESLRSSAFVKPHPAAVFQGLQTNSAQIKPETIAFKHDNTKYEEKNGDMMAPNNGISEIKCLHTLLANATKANCLHCNQQFCNTCMEMHVEKLKQAALSYADEILKKYGVINLAEAIANLERASDLSASATQLKFNGVASAVRMAMDTYLKQQSDLFSNKLKHCKEASLRIHRNMAEQLLGRRMFAAFLKLRERISKSNSPHDASDLIKFQAVTEAIAVSIATLKEVTTPNSRQIFDFMVNTDIIGALQKLDESSIGFITITAVDREKLSAINSFISAALATPVSESSNSHHQQQATASQGARVNSSVRALLETSNTLPTKRWQHLTNVTGVAVSHSKSLFVVRYEKNLMAILDGIGNVTREISIANPHGSHPTPESGDGCSSYVASGDGDFVFYSVDDGPANQRVSTKIGVVCLSDPADLKIAGTKSITTFGRKFFGMAVVDSWNTIFTSWNTFLIAHANLDSNKEKTDSFHIGEIGPDPAVHGVLSVSGNLCQLLCSNRDGLVVVEVEQLPNDEAWKFKPLSKCERLTSIGANAYCRGNPVHVLHRQNRFAVVSANRLRLFEMRQSDTISIPLLVGDFEIAELACCLSFAMMPTSSGHVVSTNGCSRYNVVVVTASKSLSMFSVTTAQ